MSCKLDRDPDRTAIDAAIVNGVSYRTIITRFPKVTLGTLNRHKHCIQDALADAMRGEQKERREHAKSLVARVEELIAEAQDVCRLAKRDKKYAAASNALNSVGRSLELIGKLTGEIAAPTNTGGIHLTKITNVNVTNFDNDPELATMLFELTKGFDPVEIDKLKAIAEKQLYGLNSSQRSLPVCNHLATPSVTALS